MNIGELGELLWNHPEPGFKEWETHRILKNAFLSDGFKVREFEDFPGFTAGTGDSLDSKRIIVIADMDALPNPESEEGSYIHSCGHHMQMTALYGAASILKNINAPILDDIAFMAIPAEEYIDFQLRTPLKDEGKIKYLSGKLELIHRGVFDHAEFIISTHTAGSTEPRYINSVLNMSGFKVMNFHFEGVSSHAGASPHKGINAQNAAALFLQSCAFLRETFSDDSHIRIHPVMRIPADQSVNLIPSSVRVETYVRAASAQDVNTTVDKLRRAAEGCSQALGSRVTISAEPGYSPFKADKHLHTLVAKTADRMGVLFKEEEFSAASSDVGDISLIKPTIMLGLPGANGMFHNPDFRVVDPETAYQFSSEFTAEYLKDVGKL